MKTLILRRVTKRSAFFPTFGVLLDGNTPICLTLELPWKENIKGLSCIPNRTYTARRYTRPDGEQTFLLEDTAPRTGILVHPGNTNADSDGCILVGSEFGALVNHAGNEVPAVLESQRAFRKLMQHLDGIDEFQLMITGW